MAGGEDRGSGVSRAMVAAWLITSVYYFLQYLLRSAPAVMLPQLSSAWDLTTAGLATLIGLFYYGYAPFSLVAGVALDQFGPRRVTPVGAAIMGVGLLMFASGDANIAAIGRFLQGVGGVFALITAAYIATSYFPASRAATMIGATQMCGMAGGSAGQFLVGPIISGGLAWNVFWLIAGAGVLAVAVALFLVLPKQRPPSAAPPGGLGDVLKALGAVFSNPQSILSGLIAGLIFLPTTIFDMVWGVRFLQEGHDIPYGMAVLRSSSVPFGWIIGCPLLGMISDRIGRRKPMILAGAAGVLVCFVLILYGPRDVFPPFALGLATGIFSGAAMIPYTVIKEANLPAYAGTATGVVNFLNFSLSALLGPVFGGLLMRASGGGERELSHYQEAFQPLAWGVGLAILLTIFLRETGPAGPARARSSEVQPA